MLNVNLEQIIILALFALPPVLGWIVFWRRRVAEPEPTHVLAQLFLFGVLSAVPLLMLRNFLEAHPDLNFFSWIVSPLILIIIFAFLEESLKGLFLIAGVEVNKRRFDKWEDGLEFAVLIALGFAFAENILYFWQEYSVGGLSFNFWSLYLFRSLGTMLGHIIFTGTFGYFYACAYVVKGIIPKKKHEKPLARFLRNLAWVLRRPFHITICHLFPRKDSAKGHTSGEVVIEGFLVALTLHALFNALFYFTPFGKSLGFLTVPILIGVGWWYGRRFRRKG